MVKNYYDRIGSIRYKFLLVVIPLLLITLIFTSLILDVNINKIETNRLTHKLDTLSDTYGRLLASSLWVLDYDRLELVLNAVIADSEVIHVSVFDEASNLITSAGAADNNGTPELHTSINIYFKINAESDPVVVGKLELQLTNAEVEAAARNRLDLSIILAILLTITITASALIANRWSIGIPLKRVMNSIRHYENTGERTQVDGSNKDEIGVVIHAFNSMQIRQSVYENELKAARDDLEQRVQRRTEALVKARDEAELAKLSMSKFLANISHELRTPLNAILGLSEFMMGEHLGPVENKKYKEYIGDIHNSGHYLLELIDDVLDLSKVEFGKMQLNETKFDLRIATTNALRIAEGWTSSSATKITQDYPEDPFIILADERAIKQILLNLFSNAIKFSTDVSDILIKLEYLPEAGCKIIVADKGQGIAPENLSKILEPFTQVDDPYTRTHKGTGLGLPLVKSLVELHGGTITITSELGVGTTVEATLPLERVIDHTA